MSSSPFSSVTLSSGATQRAPLAWPAKSRLIAAAGLILYGASFFLWAVRDSGSFAFPERGYVCAELAFLYPWGEDGGKLLHEAPIEFFALLFSGWTNPLFLVATAAVLWKPFSSVARLLSLLTAICIPFCWIVFAYDHLRPREGHIVWIAGMIVAVAPAWAHKPKASRTQELR
jgi:hypothetical protein